jgi:hypothetical protein
MTQQDLRRFVAFKAFGAYRLLVDVHSTLEDVEGAVDAGQYLTAVMQARTTLVRSLSIRSLAVGGEFLAPYDGVAFDPFAGLDPSEVEEAFRLCAAGLDLTGADAQEWVGRVRAHVAETERRLGYDTELRSIRTPDGLYPALRFAREWLPAVERLALPPLLPAAWTGKT